MEEKKQFEDWQLRIKEERDELLAKVRKLVKFIDNPESKANYAEWMLLKEQLGAMRNYLSVLDKRCKYYRLVEQESAEEFYR